jgi:hypothetical protein
VEIAATAMAAGGKDGRNGAECRQVLGICPSGYAMPFSSISEDTISIDKDIFPFIRFGSRLIVTLACFRRV